MNEAENKRRLLQTVTKSWSKEITCVDMIDRVQCQYCCMIRCAGGDARTGRRTVGNFAARIRV